MSKVEMLRTAAADYHASTGEELRDLLVDRETFDEIYLEVAKYATIRSAGGGGAGVRTLGDRWVLVDGVCVYTV